MCGRYTLTTPIEDLARLFDIGNIGQAGSSAQNTETFVGSYNIAPTTEVVAVLPDGEDGGNDRVLQTLRWGLIPSWADDPAIGNRMINARSETAHEKPSYRRAFKKSRCLILADGFYEWEKTPDGKQPHYIRMRDGSPFAFAGMWETWERDETQIKSCTILTTSPNGVLEKIHHRMPVILPEENIPAWLDPGLEDTDTLRSLLVPYETDAMESYPVSKKVNRPTNNDAGCVEPVAAA